MYSLCCMHVTAAHLHSWAVWPVWMNVLVFRKDEFGEICNFSYWTLVIYEIDMGSQIQKMVSSQTGWFSFLLKHTHYFEWYRNKIKSPWIISKSIWGSDLRLSFRKHPSVWAGWCESVYSESHLKSHFHHMIQLGSLIFGFPSPGTFFLVPPVLLSTLQATDLLHGSVFSDSQAAFQKNIISLYPLL